MNSFLNTLKSLGLGKLGLIAAILISVAGGLYYTTQRYAEPDMALLYAELDMADASKIISRIEGMGVPVELRGAGTQIYVPADRVARLRMDMAEAGLPRGGSVGYEIFDKTEALGTTGFVQDINHLRALEGELSRSISSLNSVESARVHLVLPRRELFSRDHQQPSASIIIKQTGPGRLSAPRVRAIQHLVAAAVPNLNPERVSVIDDQGNLLAKGDSTAELASASNLEEMKMAYETRLSQTIENLVGRYVGDGKVRAEVSAELDFDRLTENSEKYDPDGQVLRSSQRTEEGDQSSDANGGSKEVSVQSNLPNGGGAGGGNTSSQSKKTEETLNYEISKSLTTHVKESGGLKRLSVAVMVDGVSTKGSDGKDIYTPRPAAEMDQLKKLIASAIGFNEERKDQLEVLNMPFAKIDMSSEMTVAEKLIFGFERRDILRLAEIMIIGVLGLLALLLVIKPLLNRLLMLSSSSGMGSTATGALINTSGSETPLSVGSSASNPRLENHAPGALPIAAPSTALPTAQGRIVGAEQMLTHQKIDGPLRASSVQKVGDLIESSPDEAVTIVRNWMQESAS